VLSHNAIRNIQVVLVLAVPLAAWFLVPGEILLPTAWVLLAVAAGAVFAIRKYMRKLHSESRLDDPDRLFYAEIAMAFALVGFGAFLVLVIEYS
jgi:hypothetical protein